MACLSSKPTVSDWTESLESLVNWEKFAIFLPEIQQSDVDRICRDEAGIENRKRALWTKWTTVYPNGSWNDVSEALRKMKENTLADQIEKKFIAVKKRPPPWPCSGSSPKQEVSSQKGILKEETFERYKVELNELLQVEETLQTLTSNLITAGLISPQSSTSSTLLTDDIQSLLHHSPYHFNTVLDEMDKIESLQRIVRKMKRFFMKQRVNDLPPVPAQQHVLSKIVVKDNQQLMTFLGEAGDSAMKKYHSLCGKYEKLLVKAFEAFQNISVDGIKFHICSLLIESKELTDAYFEEIASPHHSIGSSTLLFFQRNEFLNVWNYEIFGIIVSRLLRHDKCLIDSLEEYRQEYEEFFEENLQELQRVFVRKYVTSSKFPSQFEFGFRLSDPWSKKNAQQWKEEYKKFDWSEYTAVKEIGTGSITIVYAALPCVVSSVIRDLTDPVIISELQSIGVTVILPTLNKDTVDPIRDIERIIPVVSEEMKFSQNTTGEEMMLSLVSSHHNTEISEAGENLHSSSFEISFTKTERVDKPVVYDKKLDEPLQLAVESNNIIEVIRLLKEGANPNSGYCWNRPLFIAIKHEYSEIVEVLLEYGASTFKTDLSFKTPLHNACDSDNSNIVKLLITKGKANVNAVDKYDKTPLYYAVQRCSIEIVNILLTNGARTDVMDTNNSTLLRLAFKNDNSDIIELLITKGKVDVNAVDRKNKTPLFYSIEKGTTELVNFFLTNGARTDVVNTYGNTLLHEACRSNKSDIIELLITKGKADVNAVDKYNRTPLYYAVQWDNTEVVDILLTNGARTDVVNTYGNPVLHIACRSNKSDIIELLITKGKADVNAVDKDNRTPLYYAVQECSIEVVDIFLTNGARTDVVDTDGKTLLYEACRHNNSDIVELLITKGKADGNAVNKDNRTLLYYAVQECSIEVVDILLTNGARTDVVDTDGNTLLHEACRSNNSDIVELLITKYKLDVNAVNKLGSTPLHASVEYCVRKMIQFGKNKEYSIIKMLLKAGANPNSVNEKGDTPLHIVFSRIHRFSRKLLLESVTVLLKGGADPNSVNKRSQTVLDVAEYNLKYWQFQHGSEILSLLKEFGAVSKSNEEIDLYEKDLTLTKHDPDFTFTTGREMSASLKNPSMFKKPFSTETEKSSLETISSTGRDKKSSQPHKDQ